MLAVITGATSGIGKEMAHQLARAGWSLILTGRHADILAQLCQELGKKVDTIALDLAERDAPQKLYQYCKGRDVDLLINNAGFGVFGEFSKSSLDAELEMIDVNIRAVHILTKLFLRDFKVKNKGRILSVASSAGFLTGPLMAGYYASKNYVVRLSLAIAEELRRDGSHVTISVLCPGPVDTGFNDRAGCHFTVKAQSARDVAKKGIDGVMKGKTIIIPSGSMKWALFGARFLSQKALARIGFGVQKGKEQ